MLVFATQAQEKYFMDGLLPDDGTYDKLPAKMELATKSYVILPSKCSLKLYCPAVNSQSCYSTCTGWATAYAARSIAEAVRNNWTDPQVITSESFSPAFVYAQIKGENDANCSVGTHINDALEFMKEKGVAKFRDFGQLCAKRSDIDEVLLETAKQNRLDAYTTLFNLGEKDALVKVRAVKKSLSENCPVVIAMWLDKSTFGQTKTWLDLSSLDAKFPLRSKSRGEGYHAMCVVGYDDNMQGGAFEIMNSWGTDWGNQGFFWVKYADFARTVDQAFEVVVNPLPKPLPEPEPEPEPEPQPLPVVLNEYAASVEMRWSDGGVIKPMLVTRGNMCCYQLYGELHSGDRLRMYIANNEQAYVYVFSSDLTNSVEELFPRPYVTDLSGKQMKKEYSPFLNYRSNSLVLPSEKDEKGKLDHSIRINDTKGTEYWCVLYSKVPLDFDTILDKVKSTEGTFYKKLRSTLGDKMVQIGDIHFVMNRIEFSARSEQEIVPIIIEAVHN